jgi:hypothetical protein
VVRFAAMTYGKLLLIGVIAILTVAVYNYTLPNSYIFTESNDRKYYIKVNESDSSTYFLKTVSGAGESPIWVKVD